jgi:gliding motility-associated-like protein
MMKVLLSVFFASVTVFVFSQGPPISQPQPDCEFAENICSDNGSLFQLSTGIGNVSDLPPGNNISNPSTNPGAAGNSGCLFSNELNPNWFVINVGSSGILEFQIGGPAYNGYFDWAMWPYDANACAGIQGNTLPPVACNWNASSQGFTGMAQQGNLPAGAIQGNFEYGIPVSAGDQYVLMFSNYSSMSGNVPLTFGNDIPGNNNPNTAGVTCTPGTPDQTICQGDAATVDIVAPPTIANPTFNWLVTNGVSNTTGGVGVLVSPNTTTEYHVEIFDNGALAAIDTFTITVEIPQQPDAGPDQTVCLGTPIQLAGVPDDPVNNTAIWLYDASTVTPVPNVNFVPNFMDMNAMASVNQLGTYHFIVRENNAICGNRYDTMEVIVSELNITAASVAPSCIGAADGEIHITSADAVEYSFDGGNTWVTDSFDVVFTAGTYTVCGRSLLGCEKCVDVDVIDPAPVTISINNDSTICQNGTGYLNASATGGTSYLFHWDHTTDTDNNQIVNPLASTTYTVYAENQNGCTSPPISIDITVLPSLTGTITPWDTVCPTYSTDIFATVTGGLGQPYDFVWSSGQTQNGPDNHSITVTPGQTTMYTVTITDQCESTPLVMETQVRVAPLPVPQYQVLDPDQCEPAQFTIVNTTDPTMSQYNYWWIEEQQQYVNMDTIVTDSMWAGLYDMQMIITSYEGCVDSLTFEDALNVKPKPIADFKHSPNPVLMFNTDVLFTNYSWQGHTYQWFFEEGYPATSTSTNVQVQFPDGETGAYDIRLITTSELGCVDTMDYELIVFPEVLIYAPNTFTPDGDEFNQNWRVHMEGIDFYDFELLIFNRWGEVIWESHDISVPWDGTYNGKLLPPGTYTWTIRASDVLNDNKYTYNGHVNILK